MDKQAKKPKVMSPQAQKSYDTTIAFLTALSVTLVLAIGLTASFNLATPITHLEPVSPFAVFGVLGFIEMAYWRVREFWREWRR